MLTSPENRRCKFGRQSLTTSATTMKTNVLVHSVAISLLLLMTGTAVCARAENNPETSLDPASIQLGVDGRFKLGHWTTLCVQMEPNARNPGPGSLVVTAPDDEGVPCSYTTHFNSSDPLNSSDPFNWADGLIHAYVKIGRPKGKVSVEFSAEGGHAWSRSFEIDQLGDPVLNRQQHVLVLGGDADVVETFKMKASLGEEIFLSHVPSTEFLPARWCGYDGVDALVLLTTDVEFYRKMSEDQREAIRFWIAQGGRALVSCGENAQALLADDPLLAEITDLQLIEVSPLRHTTAMESYIGASQRLDVMLRESDETEGLPLAVIRSTTGRIEIGEGEDERAVPIVLRQAYGFGHVLLVAIDLENRLFREWSGHSRLVSKLLNRALGNVNDAIAESDRGQLTHLGFDDLSGQLHVALEQFAGVRLVPFSWIAALAVVYVAIVGPAEYLMLRRFGRAKHVTWVLLPLTILGFCLMTMALGSHWKGSQSVANQLDLVDIDTAHGLVRGTTWVHLYSTEGKTIDVALRPPLDVRTASRQGGNLFSWHGMPGDSFGGMAHPGSLARAGLGFYDNSIKQDDAVHFEASIAGLPMPRWSSRAMVGNWWYDGDGLFEKAGVEKTGDAGGSLQESAYGQLTGSLRNSTPWKWQNALLIFGRWYYKLGTVVPDQVISLVDGPVALNLPTLLGRRQIVETKGVTTPWKKETMNLSRIMQMVMLHDAAGGRGYTDLLHRQQRRLDVSKLLQAGRAVVIARSADLTTQLAWDGEVTTGDSDRERAYLRVVFPVDFRE